MYRHEVYLEQNGLGLQILHSREIERPSGLVVVRLLGVFRAAYPALTTDSGIILPPETAAPNIELYGGPMGTPTHSITADNLNDFERKGAAELPRLVAAGGKIVTESLLLSSTEDTPGKQTPVASSEEIEAMFRIRYAIQSVLRGQPAPAYTSEEPKIGYYL